MELEIKKNNRIDQTRLIGVAKQQNTIPEALVSNKKIQIEGVPIQRREKTEPERKQIPKQKIMQILSKNQLEHATQMPQTGSKLQQLWKNRQYAEVCRQSGNRNKPLLEKTEKKPLTPNRVTPNESGKSMKELTF